MAFSAAIAAAAAVAVAAAVGMAAVSAAAATDQQKDHDQPDAGRIVVKAHNSHLLNGFVTVYVPGGKKGICPQKIGKKLFPGKGQNNYESGLP